MAGDTGVGETANALIRMGATNAQAFALVKILHPEAATTSKSISWYRKTLRADFEDIPISRQAPGLDLKAIRSRILDSE